MLIFRNYNTDPYLNLALEECLLAKSGQDCFMLWRNRPSIIIGRNQNTAEEINAEFVRSRDIAVVRRLSGGGAVYHDLGNLNFTFIANDTKNSFDFFRFAVLRKLGVRAEYSGRNDLTIAGQKFSGNAQYVQGNKVLHHGTLLYDSDLLVLQDALQIKPEKYESKGIKSVASRITNISSHLPKPWTIDEFATMIIEHIKNTYVGAEMSEITPADYAIAHDLVAAKYGEWKWNYGKSSPYNFQNKLRFSSGMVECRLFVEQGMICTAKIYGDFFGNKDIEEIETILVGVRHNYSDICHSLLKVDLAQYFAGIDREEIIKVLV